jgi:dipeptidase E
VEYVNNGGILIGVSAGAMLLTLNIESAYICGDENLVGLTDLSSLNLVPFMFEPHSNKSSSSAEKLKENYDLAMASEDNALGIVDDVKLIVGTPGTPGAWSKILGTD